jgi:hypothetical protein
MDVSNTTGSDTDYKVTTSGGTRLPPTKAAPKKWTKLPKHSRIRHDLDKAKRWRVEFRIAGQYGDEIVSAWCDDPNGHVQLVERDGKYVADVKPNGH